MTHYIYPQNLKATANMWLWSLRDFAIMGVAALISIVILVELHLMLPAATTLCYGFLTIRMPDIDGEQFYEVDEDEEDEA